MKGSVEATVYAANSGPISVEPGKQVSATAPAQSTAAPGEAPAPGATQPGVTTQPGTTETTPVGSVSISLADMDRATISSIGATIAASTSLPATISQGVEAQAQLAPTADQITPVTVSTQKTASSDPVQPNASKPPVAPASTSTGGGNALDATISKITDTVQQVVEKQQQPNPSPTN